MAGSTGRCKGKGEGVRERPYLAFWDRSRYGLLYLAAGFSEETVQGEVMQALRAFGIQAWVTDAGAKKARGAVGRLLSGANIPKIIASKILAAMAPVLPIGHPDVTGFMPDGRAIFLEIKAPEKVLGGKQVRPAGKLEPEQLAFLDRAHATGCVVGVVWSAKDAIEIIQAANRAA